jgi:hypothetical protein
MRPLSGFAQGPHAKSCRKQSQSDEAAEHRMTSERACANPEVKMPNCASVTVYIATDCNGDFTVGIDTDDEVNEKASDAGLGVGYQIHEFEIDLPLPD